MLGPRHLQFYAENTKIVHESFGQSCSSQASETQLTIHRIGYFVIFAVDIIGMLSVYLWGAFYIDLNDPSSTQDGAPYFYVRNSMYYRAAAFAAIHVSTAVVRVIENHNAAGKGADRNKLYLRVAFQLLVQFGCLLGVAITCWRVIDISRLNLGHVPRIALSPEKLLPDTMNSTMIDCLTGFAQNCQDLANLAVDPSIVTTLAGMSDHGISSLSDAPNYSADYSYLFDAFSKVGDGHPTAGGANHKASHKG